MKPPAVIVPMKLSVVRGFPLSEVTLESQAGIHLVLALPPEPVASLFRPDSNESYYSVRVQGDEATPLEPISKSEYLIGTPQKLN